MPGCWPVARASARRRSPIAWRGMCWRGPRSAIVRRRAWRWRPTARRHGRSARYRIRGCWCCAGPTTRAPSVSQPAFPIDEVRRLKSFLGLTAGDGAWRVVIVDAADDLNVNAANALLKSLEEPPSRALFLLVSSEPSRLLPTIRSRSRRLDLAPLAPEPLQAGRIGSVGGRRSRRAIRPGLGAAGASRQGQCAAGPATRRQRRAGAARAHRGDAEGTAEGGLAGGACLVRPAGGRRQRAALRGVLRPAAGYAGAAASRAGQGAGRGGAERRWPSG